MTKRVQVAAAVLLRGESEVLLAQRPEGKVYAGYWEFPGGKIEAGEAPADALRRELHEELGIDIGVAEPWLIRRFSYPHAEVELRFFRVRDWRGELHGREGQQFAWQQIGDWQVAPLLPANAPILSALELPPILGVSAAELSTPGAWLDAAEAAVGRGVKLIQIRDHGLPADSRMALAAELRRRVPKNAARLIWNGLPDDARRLGMDGVHLSATLLRRLVEQGLNRSADLLWGASVHSRDEMGLAETLGVDYAILGPVKETPTHPGAPTLGWGGFTEIAADTVFPIYAIGGLASADLADAYRAGAHGIASRSWVWTTTPADRI